MERTIPATEARVHFGEVTRRVAKQGERVIVERAGKPLVVIVSMDEYQRLKAAQPQQPWQSLVQRAHGQIRAELGKRELPPAEEVIRQMREERDATLSDLC